MTEERRYVAGVDWTYARKPEPDPEPVCPTQGWTGVYIPTSTQPLDPVAVFGFSDHAQRWAEKNYPGRFVLRPVRLWALPADVIPKEADLKNPFDLYQAFTITTAKYPGAGKGDPEGIAYCLFGAGGEGGETATAVADAADPFHDEKVRDELGDAGYYLAREAGEIGLAFSEIIGPFDFEKETVPDSARTFEIVYRTHLRFVGAMGRLLEVGKKRMRDAGGFAGLDGMRLGTPKTDSVWHEKAKLALTVAAKAWIEAMHVCGFKVLDVLEANEIKLTDRKRRNKLHGEGDKR